MPRVDDELEYDRSVDEARPDPRRQGFGARAPRQDRSRRIAERSQRPVLYDGMYAVDQHSRDREMARRVRQETEKARGYS